MADPIIVLGIDGLDAQKVADWAPEIHQDLTGTMSLEPFEKPYYTDEIWPAMLLGESPRNRGWTAPEGDRSSGDDVEWNNLLVGAVSSVARYTVPHSIRRQVGKRLIDLGYDPTTVQTADQWGDDHLLHGIKSKVIEVPNWHRGELNLQLSRQSWEYVIEEPDGVERFFSAVDEEIDTITTEIKEAIEYPYDIIFSHYHYLDSIQHYFEVDTQRDWYERTADLVSGFVSEYPDHRIVVVSDHGLAEHEHRGPAYVTVANPWTNETPKTPIDIRLWLSEALEECESKNREIQENLEDLGYL